MKKYTSIVCAFLCLWALLMSCSSEIKITGNLDILPTIYPDYQGVILPPNIAPLDFEVQYDEPGDWALQVITSEKSYTIHADNRLFTFDMKLWKNRLLERGAKCAFPILSFPSVSLLGVNVRELISDSDLQAKGMKAVADRTNAAASVSFMDLSVEAEAFGAEVLASD